MLLYWFRNAYIGAIIGLLICDGNSASHPMKESKDDVLPTDYVYFYDDYPIEFCYVPPSVTRSLVKQPSNPRMSYIGPDNEQSKSYECYKENEIHLKLGYDHKTVNVHLTDDELLSISSTKASMWEKYHMANVYVDKKPVMRTWLQNSDGHILLADDIENRLRIVKQDENRPSMLLFYYYIQLSEIQRPIEVVVAMEMNTCEIVYGYENSRACHHLVMGDNKVPTISECGGETYADILSNKSVEFDNISYQVITHLMITTGESSKSGTIYTMIYDKTRGCMVAIKRNLLLDGQEYKIDENEVEAFSMPITITQPASVYIRHDDSEVMAQVAPIQAGQMVGVKDDEYMVSIMPYGTLERPRNILNTVWLTKDDEVIPIVIPMLTTMPGVSLMSEEAASYLVTHKISDGSLLIDVVYRLYLPELTRTEQLRLQFKVNGTHISLLGNERKAVLLMDFATICEQDVPLGTERLCIIQESHLKNEEGILYGLYTFLYNCKTRHVNAIMSMIDWTTSHLKAPSGSITELYDDVYRSCKKVDVYVSKDGDITFMEPYIGYTSSHMAKDRQRLLVLPEGLVLKYPKYNTTFKVNGVIVARPYLSTESGFSMIDISKQPSIKRETIDDGEVINITYYLRLPGNDTPHDVTLEFHCHPINANKANNTIEIWLINKYERFKGSGDSCIIDASIWSDAPEFAREKRRVGIGNKGAYVLMTRILTQSESDESGVLYMFLYETAQSALFSISMPVKMAPNVGGKSCRWIKDGTETRYDYELGNVIQNIQDIAVIEK